MINIMDQYGRPISPSAALAQRLRAEREGSEEETVAPSTHRLACDAARTEGYFEGVAEGRKVGAAAEGKRFVDIVNGCNGNEATVLAAVDLALEFPEIPAAGCVGMAGKHFTNRARGSASLAMRDSQPDSLAVALSQLGA